MVVRIEKIASVYFNRTKDKTPFISIYCKARDDKGGLLSVVWFGFYQLEGERALRLGLGYFNMSSTISELIAMSPTRRAGYFSPPLLPVRIKPLKKIWKVTSFNERQTKVNPAS